MDTNTLRREFLNFFAKKNHKIVASSSLIPIDDPTLLFTSAGMNQFKKQFMGMTSGFDKAATCQRCLRTDDLDKVGLTAYHHTFFEMLGNFSFGAYFKKEAIHWAWEFLIDALKISPNYLWVSVYEEDQEAYNIWKDEVGISADKLVRLGPKDNFWPADAIKNGPNGPCGPCSEIFFDYGKKKGCQKPDCKPGCDCGRFVEIWNLVFTQFNRKDQGALEPLPNKNIDTGMGLERMGSVLAGVDSNFEIDIFKTIISRIENELPPGPKGNPADNKRHINAIADHARAIVFAIFDGINPSNEQRGYVVRKLIRKAGFHGYSLGIKKPFIYKIVNAVAKSYLKSYPAIDKRKKEIAEIIHSEEKIFSSTLNNAPDILEIAFKDNLSLGTGHIAFKLHDTYGIPVEITNAWAKSKGIQINNEEYQSDLAQQKERSKKSSRIVGGVFAPDTVITDIKPTKFLGYEKFASGARILKIITVKKSTQIILNQSPFYGASGGQIGDTGVILAKKGEFLVEDTQRQEKIIIHCGKVTKGALSVGQTVECKIDIERRRAVMRAHTATHMLQAALRQALGNHIKQAGSLVEPDRLRFDFTHFNQISAEELKQAEETIQQNILLNLKVNAKEMDLKNAQKIGALAFFGEKYEDKVRVLSIGNLSKEFCGGTHLTSTSEIGCFKIINESSAAKGIRRIEALTGKLSLKKAQENDKIIGELSQTLRVGEDKLVETVKSKLGELQNVKKELNAGKFKIIREQTQSVINTAQLVSGVRIITHQFTGVQIDLLRQEFDFIKAKFKESFAVCIGSTLQQKAWLVIGISEDLVSKGINASSIIKEVAIVINGDGGGRQDMAQAGGSKIEALPQALGKFREIIQGRL